MSGAQPARNGLCRAMPGQSTGLWESVKIHRSNKKDTEMIPARGKLFLGGAAVWLGMLFLLGALSRDAYTTWAMTLWVKIPCALLAGGACLWLLRDQRPPLANPLRHWVGCFVFGATTFGMMVAFAFDTLVRFTASQPHVGQAGYTITSGSKSCRYRVSFDDRFYRSRSISAGRVGRYRKHPQRVSCTLPKEVDDSAWYSCRSPAATSG